jgi:hypothetical protein
VYRLPHKSTLGDHSGSINLKVILSGSPTMLELIRTLIRKQYAVTRDQFFLMAMLMRPAIGYSAVSLILHEPRRSHPFLNA